MKPSRFAALLALGSTVLVTATCDEFPEDVESGSGPVSVSVRPLDWPASIRLEEGVELRVEVEDAQGRTVLDPPVQWASPTAGIGSLVGTGATERQFVGTGLGKAAVEAEVLDDPRFHDAKHTDTILVVLAGVEVAAPDQDTMKAVGNVVTLSGHGLGANGGEILGTGLAWRVSAGGSLSVESTGDQVAVTALAEGTDTVFVSHDLCDGACEDSVVFTVDQEPVAVTITPEQATIVAGATTTLVASSTDANDNPITTETYTWKSLAATVATVDAAGVVTGKASGTAKIVATTPNEMADTADISVVQVDSVAVSPSADTINAIGHTRSLAATVYDGDTPLQGVSVNWSSSNAAVATVNENGLVTAVTVGTAQIQAEASGKTDAVSILVRQIPGQVTVTPGRAEAEAGETVQFSAELQDSAGTAIGGASFTWASSDNTVATVSASGLATAVASGSADIVATDGGSGLSGSALFGVAIAGAQKISLSGFVGCVLTETNEVLCWGRNPHGATGIPGNTGDHNDFTGANKIPLPTGHTWTDVAAGTLHACALNDAGDIYCWGHGNSGEIGQGSYTTVDATPTLVSEPTPVNFTSVDAGEGYTCATTDTNKAYCWGRNDWGQLGTGQGSGANQPTDVFQLAGVDFAQIATSDDYWAHTCALTSAGLAYCWGNNDRGQLGNGSHSQSSSPQQVVMPSGVTFTQIAVGSQITCALGNNGGVYCWGRNDSRQILRGEVADDYPTPQAVGTETFASIGVAGQVVCGVKTGGGVMCSGGNHYGGYGNGTTDFVGAQWGTGATGVALSALDGGGGMTMCGTAATGEAYCWGSKEMGLLGTGEAAWTADPMQVPVSNVIAGDRSRWSMACALTAAGTLWCWESIDPITGHTGGNVATPVEIAPPPGESYTDVGVGENFVCTLTSDGEIYCIGDNFDGQLGDGTFNNSNSTWVKAVAPAGGVTFTSLSTGALHNCAMGSDGKPYCWGRNFEGEAGVGTTDNVGQPTEIQIPSGANFVDVQAGSEYSCGVSGNGATYCWGRNWEGQLGLGNTGQGSSVPLQVQTSTLYTSIAVGEYHTCALDGSGAAYCWGQGFNGQLGNNAFNNSSSPVTVAGFHVFEDIFVSQYESCGVKADRSMMCWGQNWAGQFGHGEYGDSSVPVSAYPGRAVKEMFGYSSTTHVVTEDGAVWSSGHHDQGDTGVGKRAYEMVPVRVGGAGSN